MRTCRERMTFSKKTLRAGGKRGGRLRRKTDFHHRVPLKRKEPKSSRTEKERDRGRGAHYHIRWPSSKSKKEGGVSKSGRDRGTKIKLTPKRPPPYPKRPKRGGGFPGGGPWKKKEKGNGVLKAPSTREKSSRREGIDPSGLDLKRSTKPPPKLLLGINSVHLNLPRAEGGGDSPT